MDVKAAGLLGVLSEGGGLIAGILILYFFQIKSGKKMGMLYGSTSGLMLAMICFDILPEALDKGRMDLVFCGIIIGTLLGVLLDDIVPNLEAKCEKHFSQTVGKTGLILALGIAVHNIPEGFALGAMGHTSDIVPNLEAKCEKHFSQTVGKTGLILALGIAVHNIPEGFALGAMGHTSEASIERFTLILALHSIPEGMAMAIPFKKSGTPMGVLMGIGIFLGGMMGLGAILGYILSGIHENLMSTGLGLAAGIILYIVCGELIPESRKIWNGRWTTILTIIGFMGGILLLYH